MWIDVEERTAGLFMAYLAATLGALEHVRMDPVTDRAGAMAALIWIDAKALKKFKDDHGPELAAFRDSVDQELLKAANLEERDKIVELMRKRRWPDLVFGSIAGVGAVAAGIAGGLALGGPVAGAALAAPGLVPAIYGALKDVQTKPDWANGHWRTPLWRSGSSVRNYPAARQANYRPSRMAIAMRRVGRGYSLGAEPYSDGGSMPALIAPLSACQTARRGFAAPNVL